jgi:hypothetical protein
MIKTILGREKALKERALSQRDAYKHAVHRYRRLLEAIEAVPDEALELVSAALQAEHYAVGLEKTCPTCRDAASVDQGEFGWHCPLCDKDFE